ncbi:MAG: hypothetical protein EHM23_35620 [Acidobacteria bacterium]|nr:MAG: hypothetical protein EHM23_35620 [Acidobacteriota bacterium]
MDTSRIKGKGDGSIRWVRLSSEGLYPASKRPEPAVRNLALAILLRALLDVVASPKRMLFSRRFARWREDAVDWFFANSDYPGSFNWVRDILGIRSNQLQNWVRVYQCSSPTGRMEMLKQLRHVHMPH